MASVDRRPYLEANLITQELLNECQDNLLNGLEAIVEITAPDDSIIRASDRNKYVGEHFYTALTNFPDVARSVGEWLGGTLLFSEMTFKLSNADGRFNNLLPQGDDFSDWKGRPVVVKIGLDQQSGTYIPVFEGTISNEGGFSRSIDSITIKARNDLDKVDQSFPSTVFTNLSHPKADDGLWGKIIPLVYGSWTENVTGSAASLPALVTNGADPLVTGDSFPVEISGSTFTSVRHRLSSGDKLLLKTDGSLPSPLIPDTDYYVKDILSVDTFTISSTLGGSVIVTSGGQSGSHTMEISETEDYRDIQLTISVNDMISMDSSSVFVFRNDLFFRVPSSLVNNIGAGNKTFEITQDDPSFQIEGENYIYSSSDSFYLKAVGKAVDGGFNDSGIVIAKDILKTYGGLVDSDFNSTWDTFRDKPSISSTKFRAYIDEQKNAMAYASSLLEQVNLEPFVDRNLDFSINSMHFDDWTTTATYRAKNWDIERGSFNPSIDDRNNFNRIRAIYNYLPNIGENAWSTGYSRNQAAINQQGKEETKVIIYPNLYQTDRVEYFSKETLKIASSFREIISCTLTPRAFLIDLGEFIKIDVDIGSTKYDDVPAMVRDIGYDPATLKVRVKVWPMTMIPFPGYEPGYNGTVGGYNATITTE